MILSTYHGTQIEFIFDQRYLNKAIDCQARNNVLVSRFFKISQPHMNYCGLPSPPELLISGSAS